MNSHTCLVHTSLWLALTLMALLSTSARAACFVYTPSTTVNIPNLVIPRDAPVGSLVGEGTSATVQPYNCSREVQNSPSQFGLKSLGKPSGFISPDGAIIYTLGSASSGLGYAVKGTSVSVCPGNTAYVDGKPPLIAASTMNKLLCDSGNVQFPVPATGNIKYLIYKIANSIPPGNIPTQQAAVFIMRSNGWWSGYESKVLISPITVSQTACSVTNKNITVPMGSVSTSDFGNPGTTAGTKAFNIALTCDKNTKVTLTLSAGGAGAADSSRGILNLDSSGTSQVASGVKLQILFKNAPIAFDTPIQVGTVYTSSACIFYIPLQAHYYRSSGPITAGQANATATLKISYQ